MSCSFAGARPGKTSTAKRIPLAACLLPALMLLFAASGLADTIVSAELPQQQDIIGIYFDENGEQDAYDTTVPNELVSGYLMIVNPSTPWGVSGWECCVETVGGAGTVFFTLVGDAINVGTPPCFAVGISGTPLMGDGVIILATLLFLQADPEEVTHFFIHEAENPSIPGFAVYADGAHAGHLIPLIWSSGHDELPDATVNDPTTNVVMTPQATVLHGCYPNPFNPSTQIRFELARPGQARLCIYDLNGRRVKRLVDQHLPAAVHTREWRGRDDEGRLVPSGLYFYRLDTESYSRTRRMVLLK